MARSLIVFVALVAFAGLVAAEFDLNTPAPVDQDASDLLYKGVSELPASALPQRSLLLSHPASPAYPSPSPAPSPAPKLECYTKIVYPVFARYWVDVKIRKSANYNRVLRQFTRYYMYKWPETFRRPDITSWNYPKMKVPLVPGTTDTYRIVVRAYFEHLNNIPRTRTGKACPISEAEAKYAIHIAKRAGDKLNHYYDYSSYDVKSVKVSRQAFTG